MFKVSEFRENMIGDGARPNLFEIFVSIPERNGSGASGDLVFKAKSGQLPGSTIGTVTQSYFGRELKFAGNRTFADWTITIINDEDFKIRNAMESWMNSINSHESNLRTTGQGQQYATDAKVFQYRKDGKLAKQYDFVGLFPIDLSPIELDWGTNDSIEEFTVTFAYQWWKAADGKITT
jgi:hypothetical protein